ncbi:hypothetical protein ACQ4PT_053296 [Festuca glaucescens]
MLVDERLGSAYDAAEASAVAALAASCVGQNPILRPSMADVVRALEQSARGSILAVGNGHGKLDKVLNLTVVKHKAEWPIGLNREDGEAKDLVDVPVVLSDNKSGINFMAEEVEEVYPMAIDYTDVLYIGTQQSSNMNKGKVKEVVESDEDEEELEDGYDSDKEADDNEGGYMYYDGEYIPELVAAEREAAIEAELEQMKKLRKQRHATENAENEEIMEKLKKMKEQKADPFLHFEVDTDVEEMFEPEEDSEVEEITEKEMSVNKKAAKCGPTSSSHHESTRHTEDGNTSASTSTAAAPPTAPARAPPAAAPARAPPAPARARAAPAASRASAPARAAPAAPRAPTAPRAPPARFSAPRTTTVSDPGTAGRRVSGRKRLLTGRMKGYLTARKFTYRQDPPAPAPAPDA